VAITTFRIRQDDSILDKGETPLSAENLEFYLCYLPDELKLFFENRGITVEAERTNAEVTISMPEEVDGQKTAVLLNEFLRKRNMSRMGLAFRQFRE
jgi:hypothetical protein